MRLRCQRLVHGRHKEVDDLDDWILEKPNDTIEPDVEECEQPTQVDVDMVELLTLVVDDLCVQVGKLKEELKNVTD
ncbi:hypothetical protein ABQD66_02820 [Enterococcus hirae]|uniref:hypothetical protein n=1 Tax=Enterococcus hirae TaxID=1354 RepID=UPI0032E383E8